MTWLLWRQHRSQAFVASLGLALFGIAVWITGVRMADDYTHALHTCPANGACDLVGQLFRGDGAIIDLVHISIAVPILLGAFLGATLVARETEHATNVLAWTQTVTRRRWVFSKVGMALAATFVWSALVSVLVTWWSGTPNALYGNRFEGAQFDTQNIAPIAFALFAVALGIAVGALLRRTLPAVVTTIVAYAAVRIVVAVYVRPHYAAAVTKIGAAGFGSIIPSGSWTLTSDLVGPTGEVVNGPLNLPLSCRDTATRDGLTKCLNQTGFHTAVHYHPAAQYWRFQWTESGLFLALAVALVALGVVWTLRHDA